MVTTNIYTQYIHTVDDNKVAVTIMMTIMVSVNVCVLVGPDPS